MGTKRKRNVPWETAFSLCDQQVPKPSQAHPVVPRRLVRSLVASFAQERMWFLQLWAGDISAYNYTVAMKLGGKLNFNALKAALDGIVCRHEVLRTIWCNANGVPRPETLDPMPVPIRWLDLSGLPPEIRWGQALKLATEIAQNHIDLSQGPIFRAAIFQLGPEEHFLLLSTNLIAFDVLSAKILFDELLSLYESFSKGVPSELDKLPIQYSDFAQWQREQMQGVVLDELLSYWTKQLSKPLPILLLPVDRSRPAAQTYSGASFDFVLPDTVSSSLMELSGNDDRNLFTILLAAFSVLAHRYVGQDDLIIGTPVPGRNAADTHRLIGPFDNMLPLRIDLSGDPSFVALLRHVQEIYLDALTYQDLPFEKIVEHARPEKSLLHADLFHVMLSFKTPPEISVNKMSLAVEQIKLPPMFTDFDLTLEFARREEIIAGSMVYNTDLFEGGTIERMVGHLKTLLEGIVANADQRISELPILTEAERRQLLVEWNMTEAEYPRDACIHELFEKQVEKTPEAVAVVFEGKELTYRELNIRANQLAHYLRKQGVGPEVLVGICMERSLEMVVGLLGILKAGGAYVPLDPEYPKERLEYMVRDTKIKLTLTHSKQVEKLSNVAEVLCLNSEWEKLAHESRENPDGAIGAENLAYVTYTSGSTGRPKGVEVVHRGVVRLVMNSGYAEFGGETFLQLATLSFDASTFEIWAALLHGAKCVVHPAGVPSSEKLGEVIRGQGVSTVWLTASLFNVVVDEAPEALQGLRQLLIGGEQLSTGHVVRAQEKLKGTKIINGYGPTECTTFTCCHEIPEGISRETVLPIGKPINNTRAYILDSRMQPVPVGIQGELYIGGDGLARGYLNRPELTAEKFIRDPFNAEPGGRLYRTGDLVRYRTDGNIEFLGRMDDQVKLRGFRIELGEIESVLGQYEGVRQAAVVLREESGDKRLVAYVVKRPDAEVGTKELRQYLQEKLPKYMIPSIFIFLESMPLNANGKVYRKALPEPDHTRPEMEGGYVGPRTPVEEELARIWAELLKIDRIGIHDNFFELGGHSLLATQVLSQIRRIFQVDLPLRRLFESPVISNLAVDIQAALNVGSKLDVPKLLPKERKGAMALSFAQQRLWFLDRLEPGSSFYNVPAVFRVRGRLDVEVLKRSLKEILRRHESLRTTFGEEGGEAVQRIGDEGTLDLVVSDLVGFPEGERDSECRRVGKEEVTQPFDIEKGPLFRARIIRLGEEEHVVVFVIHHIVTDGWSMGVFFGELKVLYEAYMKGLESPMQELAVQYADYAVWQREWLQGEVLEREIEYWNKQLEELVVLELPTDRPRPAVVSYRGAVQEFELKPELVEGLKGLSRSEGVTLYMMLLAAFQTLLHRYSGQEDIAVGTPIANRNREEIEGLIGFFINTLVMRTGMGGDPSFRELLGRVREVALGAYGHQDVPFEKVVEETHPERDLSRNPLFQVMFILQNAAEMVVNLGDLGVESLSGDTGTAKFDLTLSLMEKGRVLKGRVEYNTDLFEGGTIERMVGHLKTLLEGIVANADQRISELPILTEAERRQLLVEWNMTEAEYPRDACIHELFEKQVEKTPEAVAVVFEGKELTYRELNIRANQLAHYLRKQGVGPEVLVGICMERSLEMVVGLLGILKAGGAYVPLDPEYPKDRLVFILKDANPALCLTQASLREKLEENETKFVQLNQDWLAAQLNVSDERTVLAETTGLTSDSLAYVIFTSGSTGSPKGVQVTHRSLVNFIVSIGQILGLMPEDSILALTTIAFDISGLELLLPLSLGAKIILFDGAKSVDGAQLIDQIIKYNPTVIQATPARWRLLLDAGWKGRKGLKVLCGGEAFSKQLLVDLLELTDRVWNLYGPTETTIWSTCKLLFNTRDPISIGKPIGNTRAYVLDRKRNPVPIGMPGELYIAGDGLARGYLNRPELTAEKFIRDPFSSELGARLYRTGDLVRYRADGNIEFLGRMDDQVKLRGFRIELGEIEATLGQCEGVGQAAVVLREESGDKRLVAYVVRKREGIETGDLRRFLQEKLPEYMIPSVFVFLNELPLSVSGKVNRHVLPVPEQVRPELAVRYVGPRTPVEEELARIWAELLKIERVGIHDNFFELGGHSLLATHVISQVRRLFNVSLPLRRLFEMPTISEMAKSLTVLCDRPEHEDELAKIFAELENMSDEEAKRALADADKG
jgi:amino acid adenylation domain-containing protein